MLLDATQTARLYTCPVSYVVISVVVAACKKGARVWLGTTPREAPSLIDLIEDTTVVADNVKEAVFRNVYTSEHARKRQWIEMVACRLANDLAMR